MRRNTEPRDRVELKPQVAPPWAPPQRRRPSKQSDRRPYPRILRGQGRSAHAIITAAGQHSCRRRG
jgi:hypothetical protein